MDKTKLTQERVGDGYVRFLYDGLPVAEVYALSTPGEDKVLKWRFRRPRHEDVDLPSEAAALAHAETICLQELEGRL